MLTPSVLLRANQKVRALLHIEEEDGMSLSLIRSIAD